MLQIFSHGGRTVPHRRSSECPYIRLYPRCGAGVAKNSHPVLALGVAPRGVIPSSLPAIRGVSPFGSDTSQWKGTSMNSSHRLLLAIATVALVLPATQHAQGKAKRGGDDLYVGGIVGGRVSSSARR